MGTRTKNQIVLKKQKCGGFLFKIFEPKMSIRSTNLALAGNVLQICEGRECLVGSSIGAVKLMTRLHLKGYTVRPPFANVLLYAGTVD